MSFNFANFKKVAEDDKTVTMAHENGHQMRIIKSAIPRLQREQLKMLPLAKGGEVEGISTQGKDVRNAKKAKAKGRDGDAVMDMEFAKEEAKGRADHERMVKPKMKGLSEGGKVKYYSEAGDVQADDQNSIDQPPQAAPAPVTVNVQAAQPTAPIQEAPVQAPVVQNPAVKQALQPVNVEQPNVPEAAPNLNPNGTMNPAAVAQNSQSADEGLKNIEVAKGKALAEQNQAYTQGIAENEQRGQKYYDDVSKHVDDFANYVNSPKTKLNPLAYQQNMSSGEKVGTAFGMLFGGLAEGLGSRNLAYDFLNKQIDRDIDAQKKRADQQQTILGAYEHLYGEGKAAVSATKATMLDLYNQKAKQIALNLNTPQAAANYLKYSAQTAIEKSKALQDSAVELNNLPGTRSSKNAPAKGASQGQAAPKPSTDHILTPTADKDLVALQYNPQFKSTYDKIVTQKNGAALSDTAIDRINEAFPKLEESANQTQGLNYVRQHGESLASVPYVGGALAGGAKVMTDFLATPEGRQQMRAFDRERSAVAGAIRSALKGQVSDTLLDDTLDSLLPAWGDSPKDVQDKKKTAIQFIKDHTPKDLLGKLKNG